MNTAHPVAPEDLMAFLDDELSAMDVQSVSAHVAQCAECADTLVQFRATSEALSRWTVPVAPTRMEAAIKAAAALSASRHGSSGAGKLQTASFRGKRWLRAGGLTAAAALVIGIVFSSSRRPAQFAQMEDARPGLHQKGPIMKESLSAQQALTPIMMDSPATGASVAQLSLSDRGNDTVKPPTPMVAQTVFLRIVVKDLDTSRSALDAIIARRRGYSAELTLSAVRGGSRALQASLRVPTAELAQSLIELKSLGRTENETQSGEEVTQKHEDLAQRLKTARETENRFRAILQQRAGTLSDVLLVEERIARIRGEIEDMEARQTGLEHRVNYATIDVVLTEEYKVSLGTSGDTVAMRSHNALVAGYQNGVSTLVGVLLFMEEYGPAILIWLTILGVPLFLLWRRYKRLHSAL